MIDVDKLLDDYTKITQISRRVNALLCVMEEDAARGLKVRGRRRASPVQHYDLVATALTLSYEAINACRGLLEPIANITLIQRQLGRQLPHDEMVAIVYSEARRQ